MRARIPWGSLVCRETKICKSSDRLSNPRSNIQCTVPESAIPLLTMSGGGLIIWDTREKGTWRSKLKEPLSLFTAILAVATVALVWVAALQWETLEKTDFTVKETLQQNRDALLIQQRAFMTAKEITFEPLTMFGITSACSRMSFGKIVAIHQPKT
jgi:hypothetical protein